MVILLTALPDMLDLKKSKMRASFVSGRKTTFIFFLFYSVFFLSMPCMGVVPKNTRRGSFVTTPWQRVLKNALPSGPVQLLVLNNASYNPISPVCCWSFFSCHLSSTPSPPNALGIMEKSGPLQGPNFRPPVRQQVGLDENIGQK